MRPGTLKIKPWLSGSISRFFTPVPLEATQAWDRPAALEVAPEILPFVAQSKVDFSCGAKLAGTRSGRWPQICVSEHTAGIGRAHMQEHSYRCFCCRLFARSNIKSWMLPTIIVQLKFKLL